MMPSELEVIQDLLEDFSMAGQERSETAVLAAVLRIPRVFLAFLDVLDLRMKFRREPRLLYPPTVWTEVPVANGKTRADIGCMAFFLEGQELTVLRILIEVKVTAPLKPEQARGYETATLNRGKSGPAVLVYLATQPRVFDVARGVHASGQLQEWSEGDTIRFLRGEEAGPKRARFACVDRGDLYSRLAAYLKDPDPWRETTALRTLTSAVEDDSPIAGELVSFLRSRCHADYRLSTENTWRPIANDRRLTRLARMLGVEPEIREGFGGRYIEAWSANLDSTDRHARLHQRALLVGYFPWAAMDLWGAWRQDRVAMVLVGRLMPQEMAAVGELCSRSNLSLVALQGPGRYRFVGCPCPESVVRELRKQLEWLRSVPALWDRP